MLWPCVELQKSLPTSICMTFKLVTLRLQQLKKILGPSIEWYNVDDGCGPGTVFGKFGLKMLGETLQCVPP